MGLSPVHSEWATGGFGSLDAIAEHYRDLGCNSLRVAFQRSDTYDQSLDKIGVLGYAGFIAREIDPQVQTCIRHGLYTILDWHTFPNRSGLPGLSINQRRAYLWNTVIPLWKTIARQYKNQPGVAMYELWNEPTWPGFRTGDPTQIPFIRSWYRACIRAIRSEDVRHPILVSDYNGGWGAASERMWGGPSDTLETLDTLSPPQIVFSHHTSALNELRGENAAEDSFSEDYGVPVAYDEVEVEWNIDQNKTLGPLQNLFFDQMVRRQLSNGLHQTWECWRTGLDAFTQNWAPIRQEAGAAP